jgi:hypothetical protein
MAAHIGEKKPVTTAATGESEVMPGKHSLTGFSKQADAANPHDSTSPAAIRHGPGSMSSRK